MRIDEAIRLAATRAPLDQLVAAVREAGRIKDLEKALARDFVRPGALDIRSRKTLRRLGVVADEHDFDEAAAAESLRAMVAAGSISVGVVLSAKNCGQTTLRRVMAWARERGIEIRDEWAAP